MLAACQIAAATFNMKDACTHLVGNNDFMEHVAAYGLSYGTTEEFEFRKAIFESKAAEDIEINSNPENTFTVGHNFMSTWTDAEYKKMLGAVVPKNVTLENVTELDTVNIPASVDWRQHGAVNAVKNQGQCGSCWAFSATAAIEGHHAIQQGQLVSLAEQQLVDCDTSCYGCRGGW